MKAGLIISILLLASILGTGQTQTEILKKEIEKIIRFDTDISISETKGFIIGIVDHDSTFVIPFQSSDPDLDHLIVQSLFEIGGLTKVFTAHLVTMLDAKELISLNESINHYLPQQVQNNATEITLLDLLTHSAGMPKLPKGLGLSQTDPQNPYSGFANKDALDFYAQMTNSPHHGKFLYSHYNYALVQAVIESYLGQPIEDLMDKWILEALGLDQTSFKMKENLEPGFSTQTKPSSGWTFQCYSAALGLRSTLSDLLRYLRYHLNLDKERRELARKMHQKHEKTNVAKNLFIGSGWYIFDSKKTYPIYTHAGHTGGHKAFMGFVKETQTGVVILARSKFEVEDLGLLILRLINNTWKRKS